VVLDLSRNDALRVSTVRRALDRLADLLVPAVVAGVAVVVRVAEPTLALALEANAAVVTVGVDGAAVVALRVRVAVLPRLAVRVVVAAVENRRMHALARGVAEVAGARLAVVAVVVRRALRDHLSGIDGRHGVLRHGRVDVNRRRGVMPDDHVGLVLDSVLLHERARRLEAAEARGEDEGGGQGGKGGDPVCGLHFGLSSRQKLLIDESQPTNVFQIHPHP